MRYKHAFAPVEAEGMVETTGFTIAASGKAFRSLIDSLYSRKIEAPIRELATNAFDAHKAAGSIAPFHMHLPTMLDPVFRVRDFGTGMSHDLVMRRYTTLFDSTKDESNEEVGMLGLGSKSPFAYTDAFTLTVWLDGEKRIYSVYIGSQGQPLCSLVHREPSDEARGVGVEFPVKVTDFAKFEAAAIRVLKGFPIRPEGVPATVSQALSVPPFQSGEFWRGYPKSYLEGGFYARQGCVLYPVDLTHLLTEADAKRYGSVNATVVLDFPIGSLDFTNSREFLSYDPETVKALKAGFKRFQNDIEGICETKMQECRTPWERRTLLKTTPLFSGFGGLYTHTKIAREIEAIPDAIKEMFPKRRGDMAPLFSFITGKEGGSVAYSRRDYNYSSNLPEKVIFVYRDRPKGKLPSGSNARISQYLRKNGITAAYTMDRIRLKNWRAMGKPPILRLSELPTIERTYEKGYSLGVVGGGRFARFKMVSDGGSYLTDVDADSVEGCYFAFVNRGEIETPEGCHQYRLQDVIAISKLMKRFAGCEIAFINIRSNEAFDKFPEDIFPRFYGHEFEIIEALKQSDVRNAITVLNHNRFDDSRYCKALNSLKQMPDGNPLADMRRFWRRYNRLDGTTTSLWHGVMVQAGTMGRMYREQIIDLALSRGMEVLPPRENYFGHKISRFPYPLLPKKWERFVDFVTKSEPDYLALFKDVFPC